MNTEYCFVVSIKASASWLALKREARNAYWDEVRNMVGEYAGRVGFQYYDADAFHAHMSDMIICNTQDPLQYHHLWDRIKDTPIFSKGFYAITDVRSGIKGVSHEKTLG